MAGATQHEKRKELLSEMKNSTTLVRQPDGLQVNIKNRNICLIEVRHCKDTRPGNQLREFLLEDWDEKS
eukprot:1159552-Pelagomonas_calceolata.AAC.5